MSLSTGAIFSIIVLIVAVIFIIIGVILYELNLSKGAAQSWWVWGLIWGGVVLAVIGGIFLAISLSYDRAPVTTEVQEVQMQPIHQVQTIAQG